jgi:hypothetical protein
MAVPVRRATSSPTALTDGVLVVLDREHAPTVPVAGTPSGGAAAQCLVRRAHDQVSSLVPSTTAAPSHRRAERARRQRSSGGHTASATRYEQCLGAVLSVLRPAAPEPGQWGQPVRGRRAGRPRAAGPGPRANGALPWNG